jgi:hypothetical protein
MKQGQVDSVGLIQTQKNNGSVFVGEWKNGIRHGLGKTHKDTKTQTKQKQIRKYKKITYILVFTGFNESKVPSDQIINYVGQFVQGNVDSDGVFHYSNGNIFEGITTKGLFCFFD